VVELDPRAVGVPSAIWTTRLLAEYLAGRTGYRAVIETVRLALHRAGFVCKRPGWSLKRKAAEQPEWAKNGSGWRRS
jgi:transposase